jgi:hypothetical protein
MFVMWNGLLLKFSQRSHPLPATVRLPTLQVKVFVLQLKGPT